MIWSSRKSNIANVDSTGTVTAIAPGLDTIVATSKADPTQAGAAAVTVGNHGQPTIANRDDY